MPTIDALPPLSAAPPKAPLADVFKPQYLRLTLLLVFAYFAHITSFYYILKWVAPIVSKLGYSPSIIADVLFWASVGGATRRRDTRPALAAHEPHLAHQRRAGAGHDLDLGLRRWARTVSPDSRPSSAICGFFTNAGIVGLYTLLALAYPTHLRATGTGVVIGAGRGGAALAPILAGYLFQQGFSLQTVSIVMGCGSLFGAIALLFVKFESTSEACARRGGYVSFEALAAARGSRFP